MTVFLLDCNPEQRLELPAAPGLPGFPDLQLPLVVSSIHALRQAGKPEVWLPQKLGLVDIGGRGFF